MTEPTDIDALIAVAETWAPSECAASPVGASRIIESLAEALESTLAELHDAKREELGSYLRAIRALATTRADLARAREVIEKARAANETSWRRTDVRAILATYDQKKQP